MVALVDRHVKVLWLQPNCKWLRWMRWLLTGMHSVEEDSNRHTRLDTHSAWIPRARCHKGLPTDWAYEPGYLLLANLRPMEYGGRNRPDLVSSGILLLCIGACPFAVSRLLGQHMLDRFYPSRLSQLPYECRLRASTYLYPDTVLRRHLRILGEICNQLRRHPTPCI
jgi:hypothetical protein